MGSRHPTSDDSTVAITGNNDPTKNYTENYTYDPIGNILTKMLNGVNTNYTYAGNVESNYANPHAVTQIGDQTFSYDNNGNLIFDGTSTYAFNPKNQLTKVTKGTTVTNYTYDAQGQRLSKSQGARFTLYPNKSYNVDSDGKTTVSIFASWGMVANIETLPDSVPKVYTFATDHLGGVAVTTDSAGVPVEIQDYGTFGNPGLNDKSETFDSQRKYIGEMYDTETELNYLNARYYNSAIGRFISEDPMFWNFDKAWLADPQNQNSYAYARNNPIGLSDPTGLFVAEVAGTKFWGGGTEFSGKGGQILQSNVEKSFPGQKTGNYTWDGADNKNARSSGTEAFGSWLDGQMKGLPTNEPLNIVCHSHGCNMVAQYTNSDGAKKIDNLISLGQPVRDEYPDNEKNISNHINVYSKNDWVQRLGGGQLKSSGIVGGLFGSLGLLIGQGFGWGEFGRAGRTVNGATNLNVTDISKGGPVASHLDLFQNQAIWDRLSKSIK